MTWELARADDDRIELEHDAGRVLTATLEAGDTKRTVWSITVENRPADERLARHRWEIRDEDHLWSVLDALTYRFDPESPEKRVTRP